MEKKDPKRPIYFRDGDKVNLGELCYTGSTSGLERYSNLSGVSFDIEIERVVGFNSASRSFITRDISNLESSYSCKYGSNLSSTRKLFGNFTNLKEKLMGECDEAVEEIEAHIAKKRLKMAAIKSLKTKIRKTKLKDLTVPSL